MSRPSLSRQNLIALFGLGALLFNYPLLSLFNVQFLLSGIPVLYLYLFVAWSAVIGLLAWLARTGD